MSQGEIYKALVDKIGNNIRVAMPAIIEKYDFKTSKVDIKINVKELFENGSDIDYPIISNVPLIFPRSGGASIILPVKRGDSCLVMFLDRDISAWLLGGNNVKPETRRAHNLNDAVAIIGLTPFSLPSPAKNDQDLLISYSGTEIELKPGGVVNINAAKEINIGTENLVINCKTANVTAEEAVAVDCKNVNVTASESAVIQCKNGTITANENCDISCATARITAFSSIDTETPILTQKGNLKVEGNVEITGTSLIGGKLTTNSGIENSGANLVSSGKVFETHTHQYQDLQSAVNEAGACVLTKAPINTGAAE